MTSAERQHKIEQIAISMTKGMSAEILRRVKEVNISVHDFLDIDSAKLVAKLGLSPSKTITREARDMAWQSACREYEFVEKHKISTLFLTDEDYPYRLAQCYDAPILLYMIGECNLNVETIFNVVGTRNATPYGVEFVKSTIADLHNMLMDITVVSGLAYGIDVTAHKVCLENNIPTVAVLAHGLNMIYPAVHRGIAEQIVKQGGALVTEYSTRKVPHRRNFLERNRIVAGLCDATIVAESDIKGGAMSTAQMAFSYARDVMALPGRRSDATSRGCNHLIRKNKAALVENAADIIEITGWHPKEIKIDARQRILFPEMTIEEKLIYDFLSKNNREIGVDELHDNLGFPIARLLPILVDMEFNGIIVKYPGNRYTISN